MKKLVVPAMLVALIPVLVTLLTAFGVDLTPVLQAVCQQPIP
jgi:hypothetical protein